MTMLASQITSLAVVYSIGYSGVNQRKHQSSASLAFVREIHRDRWISRTNGQLRGKCFHLMTSSWHVSEPINTSLWQCIQSVISQIMSHYMTKEFGCLYLTGFGDGVTTDSAMHYGTWQLWREQVISDIYLIRCRLIHADIHYWWCKK